MDYKISQEDSPIMELRMESGVTDKIRNKITNFIDSLNEDYVMDLTVDQAFNDVTKRLGGGDTKIHLRDFETRKSDATMLVEDNAVRAIRYSFDVPYSGSNTAFELRPRPWPEFMDARASIWVGNLQLNFVTNDFSIEGEEKVREEFLKMISRITAGVSIINAAVAEINEAAREFIADTLKSRKEQLHALRR